VDEAAAERGVETIERALADEGPLTRSQLRERLDSADVPTDGQALVHVLFLATLRGVCVRGPMVGKEHGFVAVRDWLGETTVIEREKVEADREAALGELARRYLVGHGPASAVDLARWAGLPLGEARAGVGSISRRTVDLGDGLVDLRGREAPAPLPPPRLLGAFDPLLLGWESREPVVGGHKGLVTNNGIFRPFALVKGRAVSTWRLRKGQVEIEHLQSVTKKVTKELEVDARAVEAYLSD
jgi:hypothetical protein